MCSTNLEFTWHYELWGVHTDEGIHTAEQKNGQDNGKVTDELPHLGERKVSLYCFKACGSMDYWFLFEKE